MLLSVGLHLCCCPVIFQIYGVEFDIPIKFYNAYEKVWSERTLIEDNSPFAGVKKHNQKLTNFLKTFGPPTERPEAEFFLLLPLVCER